MVDDSTIGTLGNFSASIGKAKSKKTFNVSAIAAAALKNGTVLHYRACFPEGKRKILYVDTEQGKNHCQIVLNRILKLAGLPKDSDADNLTMLALRKYSPEVRLAITEEAIGMIPDLGLVIIDGIRDFIHDINSPGESTDVISKFMQWTDDRQIHIHTVLHQNKNDEHARGHVGTELNNKAETVMQIEPDKDDKSISVVEVIHSRDREFEPFAFRVNDDSLPELVESYQPQKRQPGRPPKEPFDPYKEIPEDSHRSALNAAFEDGNISGYNGYLERLKEGKKRWEPSSLASVLLRPDWEANMYVNHSGEPFPGAGSSYDNYVGYTNNGEGNTRYGGGRVYTPENSSQQFVPRTLPDLK